MKKIGLEKKNILFFDMRKQMGGELRFFFDRSKKYFYLELRKKVGYSFDVKNCVLSIYEVFRSF